ncbi:MAG: PQQ-binding-like beta-propeller repeat protein [Candidatus Bathyarchaeia archaeon]|jgi:hypothetical protein
MLNLKTSKSTAAILATALLVSLSVALLPLAISQVPVPSGAEIPQYAYVNVAPNPVGVGQTVTVNFFLAVPNYDSLIGGGGPTNMTVIQTDPDGTVKTLGPFTGDTTGGSYFTFVPDHTGNYTFQLKYGGQTLSGGQINLPAESKVVTLTVQEDPIERSAWPITPLPTEYWQTPVSAQNVQEWYQIMGPWLGWREEFLGSTMFAETGSYDYEGPYNPYTSSVYSGHIMWTKPWGAGGVAGGAAGGTEDTGNYWTTRQYQPQYAPVILNGIMFAQLYACDNTNPNGIVATDIYNGKTLFTINTTNPLVGGMNNVFHNLNQYGVVGPYIWTMGSLPGIVNTGTQYNMYEAMTGKYVCSIVNGTHLSVQPDDNGNLIGYYVDYSNEEEPTLNMVNMTWAIGMGNAFGWGPTGVHAMSEGLRWSVPLYNNISDVPISPQLAINGFTDNAVIMTAGFTFAQGFGGEQNGWLIVASQDMTTGAQLWCRNITAEESSTMLPFTRTQMQIQDGYWINVNMQNFNVQAYDARTGTKAWAASLKGDHGAEPNHYDIYNFKTYGGPGVVFFQGYGGDIWCYNVTTGAELWYTNTTKLVGDPGIETPYGVWPLWTFGCNCQDNNLAYFAIGHEYNPPMFHGAQLLAVNITDGTLVWSELNMAIRSNTIAYGRLLSLNAYDNQIYCYSKGPSSLTVTAPAVGVTTATPITISGTIMDVSPGTTQDMIALRFPNGVPCVSDASQSHYMEYVYQQQPLPMDTTGVPITISVVDANGNFRQIGETTSDATGHWAYVWTPDISGNFNVIASFDGTNSYWPSSSSAYFYASEPAATAPPATPAPASMVDQYFLAAVAAIIVVIILVGVGIVLALRKRP